MPSEEVIRLRIQQANGPVTRDRPLNFAEGLSADEAALVAVVVNPSLRAQRDRRDLSSAQLLQAGILPNPQLDFTLDPVTGGNTQGTVTGYNIGLGWEFTSLLTHQSKIAAARAGEASVHLDVAWQEWLVAQSAKKAVYDLQVMQLQLARAREVERQLGENMNLIRRAVEAHQKTLLESAAAEAAQLQAHSAVIAQEHEIKHQQLLLNQAMGLPPEAGLKLNQRMHLPETVRLPGADALVRGLEDRRLDLLALKKGYESQDQTVRTAILAQFPKISVGVHHASDTTNVHTTGFGITADLPIFDRNQGNIAIEEATRQKLFDEYMQRVFEARAAVALGLEDLQAGKDQLAAARDALPGLQRVVDTYKSAMNQGNVDVLSYYTALSTLVQKQLDILKLERDFLDNWVALEIAAGQRLAMNEDGLDTSTTQPATTRAFG